jgi:hypothetical protein
LSEQINHRFLELFPSRQSATAFGRPNPAKDKPGKVGFTYVTWPRAYNLDDVRHHLAGEVSIVAIPLREDGTCFFGAIDIDVPCEQPNDPDLAWFRSKSKGWHGFMFFQTPQPADKVRALLRSKAIALGFPHCEIFPKQTVAASGNGINLPFFGDPTGAANFVPRYYTVPVEEWPTPVEKDKSAVSGDDDSGYWDKAALVAMLNAYKENIPDFDFCPGRLGYMVPCPGNEEGWSDGAMHSSKDAKLSPFAEVFIQNGWPKFKCFHAHCDGGCSAPKKTINDFRSHYDPLRILFDFDEWLWDECEKRGMTR